MKLHFTPVANPAPPRPRRPEVLTSFVMSAGAMSSRALRRAAYPPFDSYTSRRRRAEVPNHLVRRGLGASPAEPRSSGIGLLLPRRSGFSGRHLRRLCRHLPVHGGCSLSLGNKV